MHNLPEPQKIEAILNHTMEVLQQSKHQMFDIVETAQAEYNRIVVSIAKLKQDIVTTIGEVDNLEKDFRKIRIKLIEVNRDFSKYGEEERRIIYQRADLIRETLAAARERERFLQQRRNDQEQALLNISNLVEKAEKSVGQVGVALDFLRGNLDEINLQLEGIQVRYQLGQKIIKMQEDERKRVAREIHDGPAQTFANVVLKAEICEQLFHACRTEELLGELGELKQSVKDSLQEVRKIIHNLRPMVLDDLGLVPAVKRMIEDAQAQTGIDFQLRIIGKNIRLDSPIEVAVFRIIQEAITNSRKYAVATKIIVKIEFLQDQISAVVEDNGVGFDMEWLNQRLATGEHFGLYGMRERIELLGGQFKLNSSQSSGTRIGIRIPLRLNKE